MSSKKGRNPFSKRIWRWFSRPGVEMRPSSSSSGCSTATLYPDYVTCPHCGEPEVEVWSREESTRCHNCGRSFRPDSH